MRNRQQDTSSKFKTKARKLINKGDYKPAIALLKKILKKDKYDIDSINVLASIYSNVNQWQESANCYKQIVKLNPLDKSAQFNLSTAYYHLKHFDAGIKLLEQFHEKQQATKDSLFLLGNFFISNGKDEKANKTYDKILCLPEINNTTRLEVADIKYIIGRITEATELYSNLILQNKKPAILDKLGICYCTVGEIDKSLSMHRKSIELDNSNKKTYSNYLLSLHYLKHIQPQQLLEEHIKYADRFYKDRETNLNTNGYSNLLLKVGFISADLRTHSVAYFVESLLMHKKKEIEIHIFSDHQQSDKTSKRFKSYKNKWHDIASLNDDDTYKLIKNSKINILIDLTGHSSKNRLGVFARRASPLQITYLGYPDTTALPTMDYRIIDNITDPVDETSYCTEELLRIPGCFLCYVPYNLAPEVNELPALKNNYITFGSFNNLSKINTSVINAWVNILKQINGSRLFIKNPSLSDPPTCEKLLQQFIDNGIDAERIQLQGRTLTVEDHLKYYNKIDVALDTFPYNGTTTTCEALWMGVPVITLKGNIHMSRVSASLLTAANMPALIAETKADYIRIATQLSSNITELKTLREMMRESLLKSSLLDHKAFADSFYTMLQQLWKQHCPRMKEAISEEYQQINQTE